MRIVYCIAGTYNSGGMERVLANKANYLSDIGHEIIIVTTDQMHRKSFFPMSPKIQMYDLDINYEENFNSGFIGKSIAFVKKQKIHRKRLTYLLGKIKADVIVSMFCGDVYLLPYMKDGSKKVLEIHFSKYKRLQYGRKGLLRLVDHIFTYRDKKIVSLYDRFIVLTDSDAQLWGKLSNLQVIPNFLPFESDARSNLTNRQIIAVGRLDYQKGFDNLINIWKKVSERSEGWVLKIIGDGPLRTQLLNQIANMGLKDRIILQNATSDIVKEYLNSSILVMTSRYEGFGMVLLEAQSVGVPTISFDCKCGPGEIIVDSRNGYLIPEGQFDMFADKLLDLINDSVKRYRMGEAAYEDSARFSAKNIMGKWITLFESLLD